MLLAPVQGAGAEAAITVVGAGLAGCEIALTLARAGVEVCLYEQKPRRRTPAQTSDNLAELVCSNSFRSRSLGNAVGLLKWEMAHAGGFIIDAAIRHSVPAGDALAVDRDAFAADITSAIRAARTVELIHEEITEIPRLPPLRSGGATGGRIVVLCTGPLTSDALSAALARRIGSEHLAFYDAIAPIIDADSIDWDIAWRQSRYDKGEGHDYVNLPFDEAGYFAFVEALLAAEQVIPRDFEGARYFEGCLPIEVMAERGAMTLAFGPLKPIGLTNPRTGRRPFAVVQLRQENAAATAYNMVGFQTRLKYHEQRRLFRTIPGMENAEFLRLGSVHRNTYVNAPELLNEGLGFRDDGDLYLAGQLAGVEGYVESAACGQLIAWHLLARVAGVELQPPPATTAFGALRRHITGDGHRRAYVPSNLNWSLFDRLSRERREQKQAHRDRLSLRARRDFAAWWESWAPLLLPS